MLEPILILFWFGVAFCVIGVIALALVILLLTGVI